MTGPAALGAIRILPAVEVRPSPDNPRKIPQSAVDIVAKSIAEFGWQQPIVVDPDYVVIVGHTRLLAAKKLRLATVPVVIADQLTPEQVRAYRIADNRSGDFTSWDFTALTAQLDELAEDFSEVLALANWQAIVADYEAIAPATDPGTGASATDPYVPTQRPDDAIASYLSREFQITVVCDNEQTARGVSAAVIDMPGVIDVRDKR